MSTTTAEPTIVAPSATPEWYAARFTGFGASESGAAAGLSKYCTRLELYCRKRRLIPEVEDTEAMEFGRHNEPLVAKRGAGKLGIPIRQYPCPMMRHPEHPFMLATPDVILESDELLECKTTNFRIARGFGEEGSDYLPDEIVCQGQQQMAVTGLSVCHVAVLIDGRTLKMFRIERNDDLIAGLIRAEAELWERVQNEDPPEPEWGHASTFDLIRAMHGTVNAEAIVLPDEMLPVFNRQLELAERIKEMEAERERLRAKLLHAMGDYAIGILPGCEFELTRSIRKATSYVVERKEHVVLNKRKADGKAARLATAEVADDSGALAAITAERRRNEAIDAAEAVLHAAGYKLREESPAGSRYYSALYKSDVRLSDHAPNEATARWMERAGVIGLRMDQPLESQLEVLKQSVSS